MMRKKKLDVADEEYYKSFNLKYKEQYVIDKINYLIFEKESIFRKECGVCNVKMHIHDVNKMKIKDLKETGEKLILIVYYKRFRCPKCFRSKMDDLDILYENSRITKRAADTIILILKEPFKIKTIENITGISWNLIKRIANER